MYRLNDDDVVKGRFRAKHGVLWFRAKHAVLWLDLCEYYEFEIEMRLKIHIDDLEC